MQESQAFLTNPHRAFVSLSLPVLISLVAEPITGLVDTAFVARLGAVPLAALGVGTAALSGTFWIFNFLSVGAQTEVAQALGRGDTKQAPRTTTLALVMAVVLSLLAVLLFVVFMQPLTAALGAAGEVQSAAITYMRVRLIGAPAVLMTMVAFGVLRGKQDMQTPLYIAVGVNVLNIVLDWLLIGGVGPFPELGIAGAGLASSISQWIGALAALGAIAQSVGFSAELNFSDAAQLFVIGGDLFIRTGLLVVFSLIATRVATEAGAQSGAAMQAIRQVYLFTALFLDAFAVTTQSLVGYFIGAADRAGARNVVRVGAWWSVGTGAAIMLLMLVSEQWVAEWLVPAEAHAVFRTAWLIAALGQPIGAFAFLTDGAHWGTGDYRFMRNAMLIAMFVGSAGLFLIDTANPNALPLIWIVTTLFVAIRGLLGMLRIWPGVGISPFWNKEASFAK